MNFEQKSSKCCPNCNRTTNCQSFLEKLTRDMQDWNCREQLDSPLPSDITLHTLEPAKTDSGMSISTDFDDDFWDLDLYQKGRSASFGGTTQYSQQFMHQKVSIRPYFNTSLETVDSGRTRYVY
ncbi:unnamed protein product [Caenorhabditis brenneri]